MVKKRGNGVVRRLNTHKDKSSVKKDEKSSVVVEEKVVKRITPTPVVEKKSFEKHVLGVEHHLPLGIKIFLGYLSILTIFYLLFSALFPYTLVFGFIMNGFLARAINLVIVLFLLSIIYGYIKRVKIAYKFVLWFFGLAITNLLLSIFLIKAGSTGLVSVFIYISFLFILVMNSIVVWYLVKTRYYFDDDYPKTVVDYDKLFITSISILWILFLIIFFVFIFFYFAQAIPKVNEFSNDLQNYFPSEAYYYCSGQDDHRDLCYLTAAIMFEKEMKTDYLCDHIQSIFYRYTCHQQIKSG